MSLWVTLEPPTVAVEPGESAVVSLSIRNVGDIVEEYHVDVVGDPGRWCSVESAAIRVYPGATGQVSLTFSPPRTSDSAAGPQVYGVRVTPREDPEAVTVPEGTLNVASFVDVRAEVLPPTVRGWRRARPRLVVSNYGNSLATGAVSAAGSGSRLDFDIRTPSLQIQPGRAHFSVLRMRPERLLWFGQKVTHPYTATVHLSGREPLKASGTYKQTALLPRWLGGIFAGLIGLTAVVVSLWFAQRPSVASDATTQVAMAGLPTVAVATPAPTPAASPKPPASSAPAAPTSAPPASSPAAVVTTTVKAPAKSSPAAPPPSAPVTVPPPIADWKLNQTGGNTAVDSVHLHDGTASNGWWAGASCLFDGTNSQITTHDPVVDTGAGGSFTVTADVYLASTDSSVEQTMVSQDGTTASGFYLQYMGTVSDAPSGVWAFSRVSADTGSPTPFRAYSTDKAKAAVWTRLAGVFDASTHQMQLYVNGKLQQTVLDPTPYATHGPLAMGRAQFGGNPTDWFHGALSNVEVFNQALTADQINAIHVDH